MYAPDCNTHVKITRLIFNRVIIAGIGRTVSYFTIDHSPLHFSGQYHMFTSMPKAISKSSLLYCKINLMMFLFGHPSNLVWALLVVVF